MENSISSKRPELVVEWSPRNLPLTPDDVSYGSNKLYWWKGSCGHEWQSSAKARSCGEKCPICSNARIIPGVNDLKTMEPELSKEWSTKNSPLEPTMIGPGTHKKVFWKGKCGHEWEASVRSRVRGAGCPYCSHNIILPGFNDLKTIFPELAEEWSDKNLPLLPSQVAPFANRKVWWRCKNGHEWNTLISTRAYGSKCPYCSGLFTLKGFNDFATLHPDLASEWSDKNYPLTPDVINERSTKNVWWKCHVCGHEWKGVVKARVHGRICPVCAEREVLQGYNDLATTDPVLLEEWDYILNSDIRPTQISRNSMRPVWWKCKFGHSWKDKVSNRTIEHKNCKTCEMEFRRVLPQLLMCGVRGPRSERTQQEKTQVMAMNETEKIYRIGGYVKRAKLNLRNSEDVKAFHRGIFERRFGGFVDGTLVDVYIDITGYKETYKRPEMLRLMRDCANGKVNLIFSETKGYLAANTKEFCYWLHFIFNVEQRVDIITDDSDFNINTILNEEHQREALIKMAEDYIYLNPPDHQRWLSSVVSAIANLGEDG